MLVRIYQSEDGVNVGVMTDELSQSGIGQSGVSQYLKQLSAIGVIRRVRAGKFVNYVRGEAPNPAVREAVRIIVDWKLQKGDKRVVEICGVLMNPFRAAAVSAVAKAGKVAASEICEKLEHQMKYLKRDLQSAVEAGLLEMDDDASPDPVYRYVEPSDTLAKELVALAR